MSADADRQEPGLGALPYLPRLAPPPTPPAPPAPAHIPAAARPPGPPPAALGTDRQPAYPAHPVPQGAFEAFLREAAARDAVAPPSWKQQQHRRSGRGALVTLLVVALLAAGGVVLARSGLLHKGPSAPPHPKEWDARVVQLVTFVEQTRGLKFDHPIFTDFLPEADFVRLFDVPADTKSDPEAQQANVDAGALLNARGEAVGYDPQQGGSAVSATTTLGFYSPDQDRLVVRGEALTPAVRTTLAHELTHALQAQHFDITLGEDNDMEVRSVIEADAMRVEDVYLATLPAADQAAVKSEHTVDADQETVMNSVPPVVIQTMYAPYELGPVLIEKVFAAEGNPGIDRLIEHPPTELTLMEPAQYSAAGPDATLAVTVPEGAMVLEPSQRFSAFQFLVMLDAWLPWDMARGAIDGWTGGGYASYRSKEGQVCFVAAASYSTDTTKASTALLWWSGAARSTAVATTSGNTVTFTACDRGAAAPTPAAPVMDTITELLYEHYFIEHSIQRQRDAGNVASADSLRPMEVCRVRGLLSQDSTIPLLMLDTLTPEQTAAMQQVLLQSSSMCPVPATPPPAFGTPVTP